MNELDPLLGTTVVLVAHPDDEVIGFGALIQRMRRAVVVFATDGAPRDPYFWKDYGTREAYSKVRSVEAEAATRVVGAEAVFLPDMVEGGIADQELFLRLPAAVPAFERVLADIRPHALLTLSYEGGHPDHDSACFIATVAGQRAGIPVWESPLYHRDPDGKGVAQKFHELLGTEVDLCIDGEELRKKLDMFHTYKSQKLTLNTFRPEIETFRPVRDYDFKHRPFPWKLNYELWQWKMTGEQVSGEFRKYLEANQDVVIG